jgi:hypothetical protein
MRHFDWGRYLDYAKSLESSEDEACLRSCISRAYYAAYGIAFRKLIENNIEIPQKVNKHDYTWWYFFEEEMRGDNTQTIYEASRELKRSRVSADYESGAILNNYSAQYAVSSAVRIINSVRAVQTIFPQRTREEYEAFKGEY